LKCIGYIYVLTFGGYSSIIGNLDDLWLFDLDTNSWKFISNASTVGGQDYPLMRSYHKMVLLSNDTVVLFGGHLYVNQYGNDLWFYNPSH